MFKPNYVYEANGEEPVPVEVIRFDPPFAYGRQALVQFEGEAEQRRVGVCFLTEIEAAPEPVYKEGVAV